MKVTITFNVNDLYRRAIGAVIESDRKATYEEVREYIIAEVEDGLGEARVWFAAYQVRPDTED